MARHQGSVLVDTNVILESHRVGSWRALAGGYRVETVEDCVTETQTGFQQRRPERQIDVRKLRESLTVIHAVTDDKRAELAMRLSDIALERGKQGLRLHQLTLDSGEESLWAHALHRGDTWVLCGPDRASLRFGIYLGFRDRLVSLEGLLEDVGHRPKSSLRSPYTKRWHRKVLEEMVIAEGTGG